MNVKELTEQVRQLPAEQAVDILCAGDAITNALCSDHARRKFKEAYDTLDKKARCGSLADQTLQRYGRLDFKNADPPHRLKMQQDKARPLWDKLIQWAEIIQQKGVDIKKQHRPSLINSNLKQVCKPIWVIPGCQSQILQPNMWLLPVKTFYTAAHQAVRKLLRIVFL